MAKVGLVKQYDKDLSLYIDIAKSLNDYRVSLIGIIEVKEWNKIKRKHKEILNRLAFRLNIKTLDLKNSFI